MTTEKNPRSIGPPANFFDGREKRGLRVMPLKHGTSDANEDPLVTSPDVFVCRPSVGTNFRVLVQREPQLRHRLAYIGRRGRGGRTGLPKRG